MKRTCTFLIMVLFPIATMAIPVGSQHARQTAEAFWQAQGLKGTLSEKLTDHAHLYLFVCNEGGFVLIGGDDVARPVLAWSADAPIGDTLNAAMRYWLDGYEQQIVRAVALGAKSSSEWRKDVSDPVTTVGPLLTTFWDQGQYYNNMTPSVGGQHCPTGCVATATAQVMKYWNWPVTGRGNHSYSSHGTQSANFASTAYAWNQMPNALTAVSTSAEVATVAQLMYHVGVAVEMQYSTNVSGAYDASFGSAAACAEHALKQYFGYANTVRSISRGYHTGQEWFGIIQNEIDSLRPVIYSGTSVSAGHAFVCDGYDSHGRLHINWGWGGYGNGYFFSDVLAPSNSGIGGNDESNYSMSQAIIIGIEPDSATPAAQYTISLISPTGGTVSGAGTYNAGTMVTLTATPADAYRFDHWSDGVKWNSRSMPIYGNMNLTASFVRADANDTLQWDNGAYTNQSYHNTNMQPIIRSVSFADSLMAGRGMLTAVMYYTVDTGMHTVTVNYGNNNSYSKTESPLQAGFWNTMYIDDTIPLDTNHSISISVTWPQHAPVMASNVFPVRAITDGMFRPHRLNVLSDNIHYGYTIGSGYYGGDTVPVTIAAVPLDSSCRFVQWNDGDTNNPRIIQLTSDSTFTAHFRGPKQVTISTWAYSSSGDVIMLQDTVLHLPEGWNTIEARTPVMGYHFTSWIWPVCYDNPRRVYISSDTSFSSIFHNNVVFLDISVNDTTLGTTSRPRGYTSRDEYIEIGAKATRPNSFIDFLSAPAWGTTNPASYDSYYTSSIEYYFDEYDPCLWPDTVQIVAQFDTIHGDTAALFSSYYPANNESTNTFTTTNFQPIAAGPIRWAVKYDRLGTGINRDIHKIQLSSKPGTRDTLRIYQGGDNAPGTLLHTQVLDFRNDMFFNYWRIVDLSSVVTVSNSSPVWVVLSSSDTSTGMYHGDYPCAYVDYSGNPNGSLWYTPGRGWEPLHIINSSGLHIDTTGNAPIFGTWAVRLISSENNTTYSTVVVNSADATQGFVSGGGTFVTGTQRTISASPHTGYRFLQWNDSITANPRTFTLTQDTVFTAYFETIPQYTVTVTSNDPDMGTVSGSGTVYEGSTTTIRATPSSGYRFTYWNDGITTNPRSVTVTSDTSFTAYFEPLPTYTVTLLSDNEEWGTVSGGGTFTSGTTITIHATPNSGYHFVYWNDNNTQNPRNITVNDNITLTAFFAANAGIDDVGDTGIIMYAKDYKIHIDEAIGEDVTIYTIDGRTIASLPNATELVAIPVTTAGVYIVKVGTHPARKVVVIR